MTATILTFDTYDFVKRLKGVGFSEEQAETITDLQKATTNNTLDQVRHEYDLDHLATKRDIKEIELKIESVRAELKKDIELVKSELKRDIEIVRKEMAETKTDLVRWIFTVGVGMGLVQIASIVFLVLRLSGTH